MLLKPETPSLNSKFEKQAVDRWKDRARNFKNNSYDEIDRLLHRAKNGDSNAEGELIKKFEPLIIKRCRYYFGKVDEDLLQMGRIKLLELIRQFDSSKREVKFSGYISKFLDYFFWDIKKSEMKKLDKEIIPTSDKELPLEASYEDRGFEKVEVADLLDKLDEKQRYVITNHVMMGATISNVGKRLNLTNEQVKYLKNKALWQLREAKLMR